MMLLELDFDFVFFFGYKVGILFFCFFYECVFFFFCRIEIVMMSIVVFLSGFSIQIFLIEVKYFGSGFFGYKTVVYYCLIRLMVRLKVDILQILYRNVEYEYYQLVLYYVFVDY